MRVALAPEASVLDWGCGDLEAARNLSSTDVTGVDIAIEALRVARTKRSDWRFLTPAQFDAVDGRPRDFVLCLDVLVHQRTADEYAQLLHRLAPLAVPAEVAAPTADEALAFPSVQLFVERAAASRTTRTPRR